MKFKRLLTGLLLVTSIIGLSSCSFSLEDLKDLIPEVPLTETGPNESETNTQNPNQETPGNLIYENLQFHFLELGNKYTGDSVYIKAGNNDILIDAGSRKSSATVIKEYVDKYCTDGKLEYVIATHAHQDHIAGFVGSKSGNDRTGIFYQYEIDTLIDFALSDATSQLYEDYLDAVDYLVKNGTKHYTAKECYNNENNAKRSYELADGITMDILWNKFYFEPSEDENDYSVCTMFNFKNKHFMFTGDLEHEGEEAMAKYYDGSTKEKTLPHVDLFKAGHHGSRTSSNDCLLKKIQPKMVCVCCCAGGSEYTSNYNTVFPTQEFIDRVAKYTDQLYVTSMFNEKTLNFEPLNGTIIVSCNGEKVGLTATNNTTKLKDSTWFNEIVYVDSNNNICSGKGKEDFFTENSKNVIAVPRRIWPNNDK